MPSPDVLYWSSECSAARNVSITALLSRVAVSSFVALSMYTVTAACSILVLVAWLRLTPPDRNKLWAHVGAFSCAVTIACSVGVAMFIASYKYAL